jgi:hypothetical protein
MLNPSRFPAASSFKAAVNAAYAAAIAAGAADNGVPSARVYYDPRYYADNVLDPDAEPLGQLGFQGLLVLADPDHVAVRP